MLEGLRMDLDTGNGGVERGGAEIDQAGRARPDEDDSPGLLARIVLAGNHLPGRDVGCRVRRPVAQPDAAIGIGRDLYVADLDVVEPGHLAESRLAAGVGSLEDVRACSL